MKKFGCGIIAFGFLFGIISFIMFGSSIFGAFNANEVKKIPLLLGDEIRSEPIKVSTKKLTQISVRATLKGTEVKTNSTNNSNYNLLYDFPLNYTVLNSDNGEKIESETTNFSSSGGFKSSTNKNINQNGGQLTATHHYKKFEVSKPGSIMVEIKLDPDTSYNTEIVNAELIVSDNVMDHSSSWLGGGALLCLSPIVMAFGGVLLILGFIMKPRQDQFR